jgi:alpha-L-arabinofuranosidase
MKIASITALILTALATTLHATEFHVAITGKDANDGTQGAPFRTIQHAAELAQPGDTITVHAGTYRERITPPRGGESDAKRVVYQAAAGEKVIITGSEPIKGWSKVTNDTWTVTMPNTFFGSFNPYAEKVHGDWFNPKGRDHHRGCVYLENEPRSEARNREEVMNPAATSQTLWFATVGDKDTTLWAQFPGVNPNEANVEINVRPTVFTPEKTNIDYLTVRGFDLRHAASNWAAPTSGQQGLVTAYWCKGWIIENNEISHSRCSGIALGKYSDEYDNQRGNKDGYDGTIADALESGGWTKEKIGGHVVRNNHIHHCGQAGIVGSLGGAFSRVENNEIHDINLNQGWDGAEMAGIKLHAAIDVVIKGNHIHKCGRFGGLWLDWMAQGTQVIGNLFHDNGGQDIFTEVNHGSFLIANNILLSPKGYLSCSQGGAYAHNLVLGKFTIRSDNRQTPYHKAHSTELVGKRDCSIGDVRWYNNLLAGKSNLNAFDGAVLPVAAAGNVFAKDAKPSTFDKEALIKSDFDLGITLTQKADGWYLTIASDPAWAIEQPRKLVTTELLGNAVIPDLPFENPDGSPIRIDTDYFGNKRDTTNPFPGPFENPIPAGAEIKVW